MSGILRSRAAVGAAVGCGLFASVAGLAGADARSSGSGWSVVGLARHGPVFYRPAGVAADGGGNIYLSDSGNFRIAKLSRAGKVVASWGGAGARPGLFGPTRGCAACDALGPGSIAVSKAGVVYVADPGNDRINVFSSNGSFVAAWHPELTEPLSLAVVDGGSVLVAGSGGEILKLSSRGAVQARWQIEEAGRPGVTLVSVAGDSRGYVYAAGWWPDSSHPGYQQHWFVQKLSSSGERLATWQDVGGTLAASGGRIYVGRGGTLVSLDPSGRVVARWTSPRFTSIVGIAVDRHQNVYVAEDESNRLVKVSSRGQTLRQWGAGGSGRGRVVLPWDVALDARGNIYVDDLRAQGVTLQRLSPTGKPLAGWNASVGHGIGVDARGNVYVVAYPGQSVLREYTPSGRLVGQWPLAHPAARITADARGDLYALGDCSGLCVDKLWRGHLVSTWMLPGDSGTVADGPLAVDAAGSLYAAELLPNLRYGIQRISLTGNRVAISRVGSRSWPRLTAIALDRQRNLYVPNIAAGRVEKLSPSGQLLNAWGLPGSLPGRFHQPAGIAIDAHGDLFVTDSGNSRLQKLSVRR